MPSDTSLHYGFDSSLWQGRTDPEPDSERWHQKVQALTEGAAPGCALLGFACDAGVARNQGRTGAAEGPEAMRRALAPLAWHRRGPAYDAGDVRCEGDAMEEAQQALADRLAALLGEGHLPIVLGGGHEVAYASWSGLAQHLATSEETAPRVGIVNLDAHFDLRDPRHVRSSGTPFSQIANDCEERGWAFRYACLGVSRAANTRALFGRADELGVLVREDREITVSRLTNIEQDLAGFIRDCDHVYLTIDLDVLPAAEAPGVSAPAARGVALALIEPLIEGIRDSGKLRLADLAELNPGRDIDGRTARAAARLVHLLTLND
ncbi:MULTISPECIES: formimidoylglutamase [unclassified Halomonas]|uniref:formimidoylglutamase n=1 Tax=unclassified Halomonas TaxID=2609666 RepID=UPI0028838A0B|nr:MULTISPECIES: formimidoylglutamase [unclassified Halomonas]MDT0502131.1 formimidoylglutamase [Halomonas sp. PAR7]MDT0510860.1 formimidoylglutamase [Halomonas sp. LES1]MDT0591611.1 formimidoylglutamase [Halomonas sp. PAR8]